MRNSAECAGLLSECLRFDVAEVCSARVNAYVNVFDHKDWRGGARDCLMNACALA
ncbi:MAG: hypothetical protein ACI4L8_06890 [Candidatus Fimadaptatus sp.]